MQWALPRNALTVLMALAFVLFAAGCSTEVTRMDAGEVKDLSGAWNDTDSQQVSEEMIKDVLNRPWFGEFSRAQNRPPAVIVGEVSNLSHEHINVNTFVADMERALINSGKVQFVTEEDRGRGATDWSTRVRRASGLVTTAFNVYLATLYNDNTVVLLLDPRWYSVALVNINPTEISAAAIGIPAVLSYAGVRGKSTRRDRWVLGTLPWH